MITEGQPGGRMTETEAFIGHCLPCDDGKYFVKTALPEVLLVSVGNVNEKTFTTLDSISAQTVNL